MSAKRSSLPADFGSYRIELANPSQYDEIVEHIRNYFVPDFMISKSIPSAVTPAHVDDFAYVARTALAENVSLVAIDNASGKIIGTRISGILDRDTADEKYDKLIDGLKDEHTRRIYAMACQLVDEVQPFKRFNVGRIYDFILLSVAREYHNKGIATNLLKLAMEFAATIGCQLAKSWFVGPMSQRAAQKNGLEVVGEIWMKQFVYKGEKVFANGSDDVNIKVMAKKII